MNLFFVLFIIISIIYAMLTNQDVTSMLLKLPKEATILFVDLFSSIIFWSGILEIISDSGLLKTLTKVLKKPLSRLFNVPRDDISLEYVSMNYVCNFLGLGNVAAVFGINAMKELDKFNQSKGEATRDMITFLLYNSQGLVIIPTSVVAIRQSFNSINPSYIIFFTLGIGILSIILITPLDRFLRRLYVN